MASAGKDSAYFGHKISVGEKWKHGLEIAGIVLGTLLIIPIPILVMTDSYKRLARCNSELNKNMIIEGRVNNLKDYILHNKNSAFLGKLKEFESYSDREIINRIKTSLEPIILGSVKIEITDVKLGEIGELIYSFDFTPKMSTILHKSLREVKIQPEFAKNYDESDLRNILFGWEVQIFDLNGRTQNKYRQVFGAIHNFYIGVALGKIPSGIDKSNDIAYGIMLRSVKGALQFDDDDGSDFSSASNAQYSEVS